MQKFEFLWQPLSGILTTAVTGCAGYDAWLRYEKANFVMKIVAYLSSSAGRTHFARTNELCQKRLQ